MQTDSDFIEGFLGGNKFVLKKIYDNSFPSVKNFILSRSGSQKDAEDVFQNALLLLFVKLKKEKVKIQSFDNYLFIVCRNLWRREKAKNRVTNVDNITLISEDLDLAGFYVEENQWELYNEKFKQLSEQCKEIIKLVFKKVPYAEIVKQFDYASQTVARQRVFKCKKRLIQLIKNDQRYSRLKS